MSTDNTFAVIKTGGKQYRVEVGRTYKFENLSGEPGSKLTLDEVLMYVSNDKVEVGAPTIKGAAVHAEIVAHGRGKKVHIVKFKRRKKYRRSQGHRQGFTEVKITDIKAA